MSGFEPLLAATRCTVYGDSTYFAQDASYSNAYACTLASSQKQMLVTEVVLGLWTMGSQGIKMFIFLQGDQHQSYNSLVNIVSNPSIFVVGDSNAAYPAYLITYS